jgi:hypothetical protein
MFIKAQMQTKPGLGDLDLRDKSARPGLVWLIPITLVQSRMQIEIKGKGHMPPYWVRCVSMVIQPTPMVSIPLAIITSMSKKSLFVKFSFKFLVHSALSICVSFSANHVTQ